MDAPNLLILTVYILIVAYIFYQAYQSLDSKVTIETNNEYLNQDLEEQQLKQLIDIKFKFQNSYDLDQLTKLQLSIQNISLEDTVYVDWNLSSITDFDKVTARVIRLTKGMKEIPQSQAITTILPGQKIEEDLSDDKSIVAPLFKPEKLKKALAKATPFSLRLFLIVSNLDGTKRSSPLHCQFIPRKLGLAKALTLALKPKKPK
jgi:hypothetical protein